MGTKESRAKLFARQRKSKAKTIKGKLRALIAFYDRDGVSWTKGTLAEERVSWNRHKQQYDANTQAYCLQGAMIALGFKEDTGGNKINSEDELSRCIIRAARQKGYPVQTVWRFNDSYNEKVVMDVLEEAIGLDC